MSRQKTFLALIVLLVSLICGAISCTAVSAWRVTKLRSFIDNWPHRNMSPPSTNYYTQVNREKSKKDALCWHVYCSSTPEVPGAMELILRVDKSYYAYNYQDESEEEPTAPNWSIASRPVPNGLTSGRDEKRSLPLMPVHVVELAGGWPMISNVAYLPSFAREFKGPSSYRTGLYFPRPNSARTKAWYVPLVPVWPGFLVNTALYAALFLAAGASVYGALHLCRRAARNALGRCAGCGYDSRGSRGGTCPECGYAVRTRSSRSRVTRIFDL